VPRASPPRPDALPAPDLPGALARGDPPPVVVLAGPERWFREDALRRLVALALPDGDPGGAFLRYDARRPEEGESVASAIDEVRSRSLFGARKVVAIDHAEAVPAPADAGARPSSLLHLARAALGPPPAAGLLVLLTGQPVKGREAIPSKALVEAGALVVDCRSLYNAPASWQRGSAPHDHELARFLARRLLEEHGKRMGLPEAHAVARLVGVDLAALADALSSLALFVGSRETVAAEDVDAVVAATRTDPAWRLVDAVMAGARDEALDLVTVALDRGVLDARGASIGRGDAVFLYLVAALHSQYRKVLLAAEALRRGEEPTAVAAGLGVPPFRAQAFLALARRDPAAWLDRHAAFFAAETGVKGGTVPPGLALERLVVDLVLPGEGVPARA